MSFADTLITGADVYTGDPAGRWAQAIAIQGGRIVAVGRDSTLLSLAGPRTNRLHLPGRMVVPGFQDAHVHPAFAGVDLGRCSLTHLRGVDAYLERIRSYAESHPNAAWIVGIGWSMDDFPGGLPHKGLLDTILPDRPAFLENRDGHGAWVNSKALERAGITRDTPDPVDGRIERDEDGEPSGMLHEGAASAMDAMLPPVSRAEWEAGILRGQDYLLSLGITAVQDAIVDPDLQAAYTALAERGALTMRTVGCLRWQRDRGAEQIDELVERRRGGSVGRFRPTSVKIMQDGVAENFTAAMTEPYLDVHGQPTGNRGISFIDPQALKSHVTRLDALGFQVHVHGLGDRAVREALDAFEAAHAANGTNDNRHHIAHVQVVHPDDLPRFRRLNVTANAQPLWACNSGQMTDLTVPFLGERRAAWQYPWAGLRRAGARLAFGSDWFVSTPNPLAEIEVAITRTPPGDRTTPTFYPGQRLDLVTALEAFTMGSAYVNHLDHLTGSLEPGKLADIAIIDQNLFEMGDRPISDARVILTMVEGATVFAAPDAES